MAYRYFHSSAHRVVLMVVTGQLDAASVEDLYRDFPEEARVAGVMVLGDLRSADGGNLRAAEMLYMSEHERRYRIGEGGGKLAVLVEGDLQVGLGNMFRAVASGLVREISLFKDLASAWDWLGAPHSIEELEARIDLLRSECQREDGQSNGRAGTGGGR